MGTMWEEIYLIYFFKGEDNLSELVRFVILHTGREYNGREFIASECVSIIREKKHEYTIEVDDEVSFE